LTPYLVDPEQEDENGNTIVKDLLHQEVKSQAEVMAVVKTGLAMRRTGTVSQIVL
jgi:hypothetical protein